MARYKSTARDLGAYVCFEDEAGQGLRPPKGRTWAPRGARPVVRVRGAGGGRVNIAGVACYRPGDRPHLYYQLRVYRRRKGEAKGFTWADYRDLIIAAHRQLSAPLIWIWDNLNIHLAPELASFAAENKEWLRVYRLPAYAPDLNPAEGIWSLLKRSMVNFAAADLDGLVRTVKRKPKKIQYWPHLSDGCLAGTGLITNRGNHEHYEFNLVRSSPRRPSRARGPGGHPGRPGSLPLGGHPARAEEPEDRCPLIPTCSRKTAW